ncbi:MAG: LysM peptidoglycan-binding domain-containing protein [Xanthobacteraceae bacterium]
MVQWRHIVVLLLTAWLGGCGSYAMFDPSTAFTSGNKQAAWTGNGNGSANEAPGADATVSAAPATDTNASNSLFARASDITTAPALAAKPAAAVPDRLLDGSFKLASTDATAVPAAPAPRTAPSPQAADKITAPRGRAYLFRGVAGLIYSRGIDRLAARIRRTGIPASVDTYLLWRPTADAAIRDYRRDPQPITLIGHSMGGDAVLDFAEYLNAAHIPVSLLVTYDPTRIADDVPPNVARYINIYQSSSFMGGGNVVQGTRFHGHYASYNLKDHTEIVHINIEKENRIQEQLAAKVLQISQTPADAEGEAVPIRMEVPADAPIELWDSGLPVQAHAGDSLKTLSATYQVPQWALSQLNSVSEREPLSEGQRIVIPRYLVPMPTPVAVSSYAPQSR